MNYVDILILGGGVAGLSAANHLSNKGVSVALLEGGAYPSHKVCGEFLSPESLPLLKDWGVSPSAIVDQMTLQGLKKGVTVKLPKRCGVLPRYVLEKQLLQRAEEKGILIKTKDPVVHIEYAKSCLVTLASGEQWKAKQLFIGTGRLTQKCAPHFHYIGAKMHFKGVNLPRELRMYLMPGAYFGVAPIRDHHINVAGLIRCSLEEAKDPKATLKRFFSSSSPLKLLPFLEKGQPLFEEWLTTPVPEFGVQKPSYRENVFFVGDAAGSIPPATGNGLAMGLTSGILAAECALNGNAHTYWRYWKQTYQWRILKGKALHRLFLSPFFSGKIPKVTRMLPSLADLIFHQTRGK